MASMVHGLEAEYFGKVKFTYLQRDDPRNEEINRLLSVTYQPEFYLLDPGGVVLQRLTGPVSEETFRNLFAAYIQ